MSSSDSLKDFPEIRDFENGANEIQNMSSSDSLEDFPEIRDFENGANENTKNQVLIGGSSSSTERFGDQKKKSNSISNQTVADPAEDFSSSAESETESSNRNLGRDLKRGLDLKRLGNGGLLNHPHSASARAGSIRDRLTNTSLDLKELGNRRRANQTNQIKHRL